MYITKASSVVGLKINSFTTQQDSIIVVPIVHSELQLFEHLDIHFTEKTYQGYVFGVL